MQNGKDAIRQFILKKYVPGESADNLSDETALRTSGILDSLATIGVVNFIEKESASRSRSRRTRRTWTPSTRSRTWPGWSSASVPR